MIPWIHDSKRRSIRPKKENRRFVHAIFRNEKIQLLAVALGTAAAGEFKINPIPGDLFRIALGGSAFLLLLLLMNRLSYVKAGLCTAAAVVMFRVLLDLLFATGDFSLENSLRMHTSSGLYYLIFAVGLLPLQRRIGSMNALALGACCAGIDLASNGAEMLCRWLLNGSDIANPATWGYIAVVGLARGFFVTGLYSSIAVSQIRALHLEQSKRMEQMLTVNSGLYGEIFYLRKSMAAIERVTGDSYRLYADLKREGLEEMGRRQLKLTQELHEVKKDSQRIAAGLLKLFDQESKTRLTLSEIADYAVRGNRKYAAMLGKPILFDVETSEDYATAQHLPLLSLLNNLLANAVEATERSGVIGLTIRQIGGRTRLAVRDTGRGISEKNLLLVFEPGFTTKFGESGTAATGIGLSHVCDIVHELGGEIRLLPIGEDGWMTTFEADFPTERLKKGE